MASGKIADLCRQSLKVAYGTEEVTGTAAVTTGLTTIVAACATMVEDASLTNGFGVTTTFTGGALTLKVWKSTNSTTTTPIAGAAACTVHWIAIGV